jgi:hypothetical protein
MDGIIGPQKGIHLREEDQMAPLAAMAGPGQAQFSFSPVGGEMLTPEAVLGVNLRQLLVRQGTRALEVDGKVVAYLVAPEDMAMFEGAEDLLAGKAIAKAYRDQGDRPFSDFNEFMSELGLD